MKDKLGCFAIGLIVVLIVGLIVLFLEREQIRGDVMNGFLIDVAEFSGEKHGRLPKSWAEFGDWKQGKTGKPWHPKGLESAIALNWGAQVDPKRNSDWLVRVEDPHYKRFESYWNDLLKRLVAARLVASGTPTMYP